MNVHPVIVELMFYGLCLGAVTHLGTWFTSKGLHWLIQALTGAKE